MRGFEAELWTRPTRGLTLTGSLSFNDAVITKDYCAVQPSYTGEPCAAGNILAPKGARLPVTARVKANALARYQFPLAGELTGHVQTALIYEGNRTTDLRTLEQGIKGDLPAYTTIDASLGVEGGMWTAEIFATNLFDKRAYSTIGVQCLETVCGAPDASTGLDGKFYRTPIQPRTIGAKVGFRF